MNRIVDFLEAFTNFLAALVMALLGLRLVFRLFGANSANDFVSWVYDTSRPLIEPFENVFPTVRLEDGFVLEISTLLALFVYALAVALVLYGLNAIFGGATNTTKTTTRRK